MTPGKILTLLFLLLCFSKTYGQFKSKQYQGTITLSQEKELSLEMKITFDPDSLRGSYYYINVGTDMFVKGTLNGSKISFTEYNPAGKATGMFTGTYYTKGDSMKGKWTNMKKTVSYPFIFYQEDWCDYKIVEHFLKDDDEEYNWFEMKENRDTNAQKIFNEFDENKPKQLSKGFIGYAEDGDTIPYTYCTWSSMCAKNDYFICFSFFHSDYFGGAGGSNNIAYYTMDLKTHEFLGLDGLLRTDTAAKKILFRLIENTIKKRGDWEYFVEDYGANFFTDEYSYYYFYFTEEAMYFFLPRQGAETNILGLADVKINYKDIIKILNKESVVYEWLKSKGKEEQDKN